MSKNNDFLNSANSICENQAEYNILLDLYSECTDKIFLLEIVELSKVKFEYAKILNFIIQNYKSFDLRKFQFTANSSLDMKILKHKSGSSFKEEELFNIAIDMSKENDSYILVRTNNVLVLIHKGKFDKDFKSIFYDRQVLININNQKRDINELELVFENFHSERKYKGWKYIENNKLKNCVSEQHLRNSLIEFLKSTTKLYIVPELCTSKYNDEESVDIGVINTNSEVAIIEVKYFVKQGFFLDSNKSAYSSSRFEDGYKQLNKYCIHLSKQDYKLHSAFLYMFYAHSKSVKEIKEIGEKYYNKFVNDKDNECSDDFKQHYKSTICDNMIDIKLSV